MPTWRRIYCLIRGISLVTFTADGTDDYDQLVGDLRRSQFKKINPERFGREYVFQVLTESGTMFFQAMGPRELLEWESSVPSFQNGGGPVLL